MGIEGDMGEINKLGFAINTNKDLIIINLA